MDLAIDLAPMTSHVSYLPDEILNVILHNLAVKDIYNFLQTSRNLSVRALKIYLVKSIETKSNIHNEDLYYKTLEEVRDIHNLLFKPGYLYVVHNHTPTNTNNSHIIEVPNNMTPVVPEGFIKICSDGLNITIGLTANGTAHVYGMIVLFLDPEKYPHDEVFNRIQPSHSYILYPSQGERYIDAYIYSPMMCILLSNKGKCYGIGHYQYEVFGIFSDVDTVFRTPKEIFPIHNVKQVELSTNVVMILTERKDALVYRDLIAGNIFYPDPYKVEYIISNVNYINLNNGKCTYISNEGDVYQTYSDSDRKLIERLGISVCEGRGYYKIPTLKNIVQVHRRLYSITSANNKNTLVELDIFLDKKGHIYFLVIRVNVLRLGHVDRELIKGPYELPYFDNIVKIFVGNLSYGFITMYGQAYVSNIQQYTSLESLMYSIENPRLISIPSNLRAKDIFQYEDNIHLLLQPKQ